MRQRPAPSPGLRAKEEGWRVRLAGPRQREPRSVCGKDRPTRALAAARDLGGKVGAGLRAGRRRLGHCPGPVRPDRGGSGPEGGEQSGKVDGAKEGPACAGEDGFQGHGGITPAPKGCVQLCVCVCPSHRPQHFFLSPKFSRWCLHITAPGNE